MAKEKFTGVKGMNDMLPQDAAIWQFVQKTCVGVLEEYGYQEIRFLKIPASSRAAWAK